MEFNVSFTTESGLLAILAFIIMTIVPIKIGASITSAKRSSFGVCTATALISLITTTLALSFFDGIVSLVVAFCYMVAVYWLILRPTLLGSVGLTILVFIIQAALMQAFISLDVFTSA